MRRLCLFLMLAVLPLCCGCGALDAQAATEPGRVLWNETDAAAQIASLQSATVSRFEGIESRLDVLESREPEAAVATFPVAEFALAPEATPICITVAGTDYDLDEFLEDWCRPESDWTWEGQAGADPEGTLRRHLADDLAVTGIDALSFAELQQVHEAVHHWALAPADEKVSSRTREKESSSAQTRLKSKETTKSVQVTDLPSILPDSTPSTCPDGQCPLPGQVTTATSQTVRWSTSSSSHSRKAQRLARKGR